MATNAVVTILIAALSISLYFHKKQLQQLVFSREDEALKGLDEAVGNSTSRYDKVAVG